MKTTIKWVAAALVAVATVTTALAQPAPGYWQPYVLSSASWSNRLAGTISMTNLQFIDISAYRSAVSVELQQQNVTASPSGGGMVWIGKSNGPLSDYSTGATGGTSTNNIDYFCVMSNVQASAQGTALLMSVVHTNFTTATSGNNCPIGYRYLVIGPITNCAAAANYMTNYKILVTGN
jgi:hypothetical protein